MKSDAELLLENQVRRERMEKEIDAPVITVKVIDDSWGWWFKKGEIHNVQWSPNKATRDAELDFCSCGECQKNRAGKDLYDIYEVLNPGSDNHGAIIPVICCETISPKDE